MLSHRHFLAARASAIETANRLTRYIAIVRELCEWAELPGEFNNSQTWAPALAYEMTSGFWRGHRMELVAPDDAVFEDVVGAGACKTRWRDRSAEMKLRAKQLLTLTGRWRPIASSSKPAADDE